MNPHLASVETLARRVRVARGLEPGDAVFRGGQIVDVFTQRVYPANVVIADGWIAGVGNHDWQAPIVHDATGRFLLPGLIDAHIHVESTLLLPSALARVIGPRGTTTLIADPHEIINVMGAAGLDVLLEDSANIPLDVLFMASSCVPASAWEEAGAEMDAEAIQSLMQHPRVLGLAEMMNFPAVLAGDPKVLAKVAAGHRLGKPVDGHAPGLSGLDLIAYVAAGIRSDHESTHTEEALAKARLGMLVQVREGSAEHNLDELLPLMVADELGDWCLASDDVLPDDLLRHGHLDGLLRRCVAAGIPAAKAVRHASLIPARHYGLTDRGALAPGLRADLVMVADLESFSPILAIKDGQPILPAAPKDHATGRSAPTNTVRLGELDAERFRLRLSSDVCPAIALIPGQIVTASATRTVARIDGFYAFRPEDDVVVIANVERHGRSGRVGLGLVTGFGLKSRGALGTSVGHDAHNLVIAGTHPEEMLAAARALEHSGGGFVVIASGKVASLVPLPVAGLFSTADAATVVGQLDHAHAAAKSLGCTVPAPFGILSFLALSVIPSLRVTTHGFLDVNQQRLVAL